MFYSGYMLCQDIKARLVADWHDVLRYAWSVRIIVVAALLSGLEIALPIIGYRLPIDDFWRAVIYLVLTVAAFVARLLAQKKASKR